MSRQASKRSRHQQRACSRKMRFDTQEAALAAAQRARVTFYKCRSCRGFHLTKESQA